MIRRSYHHATAYRIAANQTGPAHIMRNTGAGTVNDVAIGHAYPCANDAATALRAAVDAVGLDMAEVDTIGAPFIVAYTWTPDSLEQALASGRPACPHRRMVEHAMTPTVQPFYVPDTFVSTPAGLVPDDATPADLEYGDTDLIDDACTVLYWECRDCSRVWLAAPDNDDADMRAMLTDVAAARSTFAVQL